MLQLCPTQKVAEWLGERWESGVGWQQAGDALPTSPLPSPGSIGSSRGIGSFHLSVWFALLLTLKAFPGAT